MSTISEELRTKRDASLQEEYEENKQFSYLPVIIRNGLIAGALMGTYLTLLQFANIENSIWLKFVKYLFLMMVLGIVLKNAKNYYPPVSYFRQGLKIGAGISVIAASVLMVLNIILFSFDADLSFNKFSLEAQNIGQLMILDVTILFEVFVYGMILTFICLQFLKYQNPKAEKPL